MKNTHTKFLCLLAIGAFLMATSSLWAWESYHDNTHDPQDTIGNCAGGPTDSCHAGFNSGNPGDSHAIHAAITTNCTLCHTGATPPGLPNNNPFTMWSVGNSDPPDTYGCTGCHGRDYGEAIEDHYDNDFQGPTLPFLIKGLSKMSGYGLRKHHINAVAAITDCLPCHADKAQSLIQGEQVPPPYYGRADVNVAGPCSDNLDNDGDGLTDAADPDCQTSVPDIAVTDSVLPSADLSVPFGNAVQGTTLDRSVTVNNTGTADLLLGTVALSDPLALPFSIVNDLCSGNTIAAGANCTFSVRFAPASQGTFNDTFDIPSNDLDENPVIVSVSGTATLVAEPDIQVTDSVSPTTDLSVPFGSVAVGNSSPVQGVTVANVGTAGLTLGNVAVADSLSPPFTIVNENCSGQFLPVSSSCFINLRFSPTSIATFTDTFDIPSDDPDENPVTVSVSGTGTALPVPDITVDLQLPFGDVVQGTTSDQVLTVTNDGSADLVIGTIAVTNPLAAPFSIVTDNCSNQTLAATNTCDITARFSPAATGPAGDGFDIPSNDPDEPTSTISVSGNGVAAGGGGGSSGGGCSIARDDESPIGGAFPYMILILAALSFAVTKRR